MSNITRLKPLFHPGRLLVTPGALAALRANSIPVISVMLRHIAGDWGCVSDDDRRENDLSIQAGLRLISLYPLPDGSRILVVTEWNRSHTTIRLAGDMSAALRPDDSLAGLGWQPPHIATVISRRASSGLQGFAESPYWRKGGIAGRSVCRQQAIHEVMRIDVQYT